MELNAHPVIVIGKIQTGNQSTTKNIRYYKIIMQCIKVNYYAV